MKYRQLGRTGLYVSELCLGTMTFGGGQGMWRAIGSLQQQEAETLIAQAHDAGINFIDTADVYAEGLAETITGRAIRNLKLRREEIVLATKVYGQMGDGPNDRGASRARIMDGVKASLKRLELDHIDLYQIHARDPITPVEETLRALDDLVRQGLVRYIGVSNWAAWHIAKALGIADRLNLTRPATLQAYYTIAGRDLEREIIPCLQEEGLGLLVWSPLAGGLLSGKFSRDAKGTEGDRRTSFDFPPVNLDRAWAVIDAMRPIAERHQVSVAQVAIAWLLAQRAVTSVIIGAKRPDQLADNIAASQLTLTDADMADLERVSALPVEYPHWMFALQGGRRVPQPK